METFIMSNDSPGIIFNDVDTYERYMGVWSRKVGAQFIDWVKFSNNQNFLDIGCGNGAFSVQIDDLCNPKSIFGIDPSKAQIEYALKRKMNTPSNFEVGDSMYLPFQNDRFDASLMALVIFFIPDPKKGVLEMARVTKPGGVLAAYAWDVSSGGLPMEPMHKIMRKMGIKYPLPPSVEASQKTMMAKLWADCGLTEIETTSFHVSRSFKNFEEYWNISSVGPSVAGILSNLGADVVDNIKFKLKETLERDDEGKITSKAFANAVKGLKPN
jgi:ubiquinone/menaquinone biosynthesis C-methylase UbiE